MPALAVPPGTDISNVAMATFDTGGAPIAVSSNTTVTTTVAARTGGTLEFLRYDPSLGSPENVDSSQLCSTSGALGGPYVSMPNPTNGSGANLDLSSPLPLRSGALYLAGEPVFARVTDLDQNVDPLVIESVEARYSVAATGDVEVATLYETGPDTGIFTGSIMLVGPPASVGDCVLSVVPDSSIVVEYTDPVDGTDVSQASALVDPAGVIFDSGTGSLMDGISISLVDASTGNPATVYGDDGLSSYPATVVTGTSATDSSGTIYTFSPGQYRFPLVQSGSYRLVVLPPAGYESPSSVPTGVLQGLPGAPFNIVQGSRGEAFIIGAGSSVDIDVPLDVETSGLFVNKLASKSHVETGEFVQYRVSISSGLGTAPAIGSVLVDRLPVGFRYEEGSGRLSDGPSIEPTISANGRELRFDLGDILPGDSVDVSYVVAVTQASSAKVAINTAVLLTENGLESNVASASVTVVEDRLASRVLLMGRVTLDECGDEIDPWEAGVPGVRLYLEDGAFVVTDERGRFHMEAVRVGVHILQLDESTLPEGYEAVSCNGDSAYARQPLSQFVDAQAGTMWRTDFHLKRKRGALSHQLRIEQAGEAVETTLDVRLGDVGVEKLSAVFMLPEDLELIEGSVRIGGEPVESSLMGGALSVALPEAEADSHFTIAFSATPKATAAASDESGKIRALLMGKDGNGKALRSEIAEVSTPSAGSPEPAASTELTLDLVAPLADMSERLPPAEVEEVRVEDRFDKYWLDEQEPGRRWVYPEEGFVPGIASLKLGVTHLPGEVAELRLAGQKVSGLNHDGTFRDKDAKIAMSRWRGVDIDDGENRFEVVFFDEAGVETGRIERTIYFTGGPVTAELVPEESTLVADGRTHPVVAVRMKDRFGRLVREGVTGVFSVDTPYQSRQEVEELQRTAITRIEEVQPTYIVGKDGIAKIQLHPTSVAGEANVHFLFDVDHERHVAAWLSPGDRDWILVAVANGDLGYNDQTGSQAMLNEHGHETGFFQEGRIAFFAKGTVTGDWILTVAYDSDKEEEEVGRRLKQVIDPDEYYTLYGDSTDRGFDAASSGPVYVKIEREKFYALYGDYETSLNQTELAAYNRTLTGLKTEHYGDRLRVNGFVSETNQFFQRDEIRGDGTSGLYRLTYDGIVFGSDQISIQVRDRFRSEVILKETRLISGIDYNIDFLDGTLFFRQPILSRDKDLNPIYIVADYEVESNSFEDFNGGGRIAARFQDGDIEIGASAIHQEAGLRQGDLVGVDGRYTIGDNTEIRAEVAYSDNEISGVETSGVGYLVEVEHAMNDTQARAYVREIPTDFGLGQQNVSEVGTRKYGVDFTHEFNPEWLAAAEFFRQENLDNNKTRNVFEINGRYNKDPYTGTLGLRHVNADEENITQLLYGGSRNFMEGRLDLYTSGEVGLYGGDSDGDYGDRFLLGADFKINDRVTVFGQNEFLWTDGQDSIDTRGGFRITPWRGATVNTSYTHETMESGIRGFANLGLTQSFNLGEHWSFSGSLDRSQTVLNEGFEPFNVDVPLTTGDATQDFTATSIGAAYNKNGLSTTGRFENRVGDFETNWGVFLSALQEHGERTSYAGNFEFFFDDLYNGTQNYESRLRLSLAHRPDDSRWILLNRLDFELFQEQGPSFDTRSRRIVDHFKANHQMTDQLQVAYQLGLKYVVDTINGQDYDTSGGIFGLEARYNFRKNWDVSFHARTRHTFSDNIFDSNVGASLGYAVVRNVWVSVGYNFTGFYDDEFSAGEYTTQGPYIRFRANMDQTIVRDVLDHFRKR